MITLGDERPTARKEHVCQECWRKIQPGDQYRRQRNIGDDGPYVWKACHQCATFLSDLWHNDFRGWDDYSSYPDLTGMDWPEVALLGDVWVHRIVLWRRKWRRRGQLVDYPVEKS